MGHHDNDDDNFKVIPRTAMLCSRLKMIRPIEILISNEKTLKKAMAR